MKRTISALLAVIMLVSCLSACTSSDDMSEVKFGENEPAQTTEQEKITTPPQTTKALETTKEPETTVPETTPTPSPEQGNHTDPSVVGKVDISALPAGLNMLFETEKSIYTVASTALSYRDYDTGKYGVISMNGKKYTGAIYADADYINGYISVRMKEIDTTDISSINSCGVLDEELNTIIPFEYAKFSKVGDRYVYAIKVTERTDNKDEAVLYVSDDLFTITPGENDVLYKGTWCVYDVKTGKKIDAASGSGDVSIYSYGDIISWTEKDGTTHRVNPKGEELPANITLLDNGAYISGSTVYDCYKNKLFTFDLETMSVKGVEGEELFVGFLLKETKYMILDKKGEPVSEYKFDSRPMVYGNTVISDYIVYDLNGQKLLEENYISAYDAGTYRIFKGNEGSIAVLDTKDNSVIYRAVDTDITVYSSGELYKTIDGKKMRFSYADKDFTIEDSSYTYENGLTVRNDGDKSEIYDLFTGKSVLGGYDRYTLTEGDDGLVYIMVTNKDYNKEIYVYKR